MQRLDGIRVYLDAADIASIADGHVAAEEIDLFHRALQETQAIVIFSACHPWDFQDAEATSRERRLRVFDSFPMVGWPVHSPLEIEGDTPARDLELRRIESVYEHLAQPEVHAALESIRSLKFVVHEAEQAGLEADRASKGQALPDKELRSLLRVLVNGAGSGSDPVSILANLKQLEAFQHRDASILEAQVESLLPILDQALQALPDDLDDDEIMARAMDNHTPELGHAQPAHYLQRVLADEKRKDLQPTRKRKPSDMLDIQHAQFLPYVDVFTADKETINGLSRHENKIRKIRAARLVQVRKLGEVVASIRELAESCQ